MSFQNNFTVNEYRYVIVLNCSLYILEILISTIKVTERKQYTSVLSALVATLVVFYLATLSDPRTI